VINKILNATSGHWLQGCNQRDFCRANSLPSVPETTSLPLGSRLTILLLCIEQCLDIFSCQDVQTANYCHYGCRIICIMPVTGAFVSPLRIGRERTREGGRIVILHSTGWTGINTRVVAVLLYGALMRRKVAGDSADVVSGPLERGVEVPGVGVGASTGCARIVAIHDARRCASVFCTDVSY
jgi:hypothetical protein